MADSANQHRVFEFEIAARSEERTFEGCGGSRRFHFCCGPNAAAERPCAEVRCAALTVLHGPVMRARRSTVDFPRRYEGLSIAFTLRMKFVKAR